MDGILLIDKPRGWTSHDVVAKVRGIIKKDSKTRIKVGHSGTLDPLATGLLILLIGRATKSASEFSALDKKYWVEAKLGASSDTDDADGEVTDHKCAQPDKGQVIEVVDRFIGQQIQTPPAYSAVKVDGKRAYKLARSGKEVTIKPRMVSIYSIENADYAWPKLTFDVEVSSGTYIRSLIRDIGETLGTKAYVNQLRRVRVGKHHVDQALVMDDLNIGKIQEAIVSIT